MKRNIITRHLIIPALLLLAFSNKVNSEELSIGWELWYPYQYRNTSQELIGLDFDIINALVKEANFKVNFTELPWKRHLHYIKTGVIDIAMGASYSIEREKYAYFTEPYRSELVKLYVKKGAATKIKLSSLSDLSTSNYMIGVEGGYFYGDDFKSLILESQFREHINEVIDLEENINLTLKGHLDGFLVDPVTMKAFVTKYKLEGEFEPHSLEIYQDDIYFMLSKKSLDQNTVNQFNTAIKTLKQNGTLNKITERWLKQ